MGGEPGGAAATLASTEILPQLAAIGVRTAAGGPRSTKTRLGRQMNW
jgi:hypothetical protein